MLLMLGFESVWGHSQALFYPDEYNRKGIPVCHLVTKMKGFGEILLYFGLIT